VGWRGETPRSFIAGAPTSRAVRRPALPPRVCVPRLIPSPTHLPLSHSWSLSKSLDAVTVVIALRSSWLIVTETEELMGVLARTSRLPQYLMHAMFDGAEWVAWMVVDAISRRGFSLQ
jgi:hypothetical protein